MKRLNKLWKECMQQVQTDLKKFQYESFKNNIANYCHRLI
jgi:hypothetical protein